MGVDMTKERDIHIDILRSIGLLLVILAHIPINGIVKSIRSFDVMLLVFIAGISFVKSRRNRGQFEYKRYLIGRIKRLCIPTWITLGIIFFLAAILCIIAHREYLYSFKQIMESVLFIGGMNGGIGNVWIVRIYMLMAFMSPLFIFLNKKINNDLCLIGILLSFLTINEIIVQLFYVEGTIFGGIIENIISSALVYSVGFVTGVRVADEKNKSCLRKSIIVYGGGFAIVQIVLLFNGGGFSPNNFKYPPQVYYALYGMVGSIIAYLVCIRINIHGKRVRGIIVWLSKKSFDVYLAHTIVLKLISWGDSYIGSAIIFRIGALYYVFVLLSSIVLVCIKDILMAKFMRLK